MRSTGGHGEGSRGGAYAATAGVLLSVLLPVLPLVLLGMTTARSAPGSPEEDLGGVRGVDRFGPRAYLTGPPPGHTGGFGEPDCTACHFDAPVNAERGELRVDGLPDRYAPGESYRLRVTLEAPELGRAGFQLAARFGQGDRRGTSAGTLTAEDFTVQVISGDESDGDGEPEQDLHYAQHTEAGSGPPARASARRYAWSVRWTAPKAPDGPVLFHAAANAANDDASEFGDRVFTLEDRVNPAEGG